MYLHCFIDTLYNLRLEWRDKMTTCLATFAFLPNILIDIDLKKLK
jgi:hypothetical protein